ncbi:zf-TFIIB domain-containing protein [Myxococcota bacterium]|nr:zf-TFIIB domain-containing protein [Myxococcota bacterium]
MLTACEHCGAPLTPVEGKNYLLCNYCMSFHFPQAKKDGVVPGNEFSGHACPVCAHVLVRSTIEGMEAFYCEKCRGILLERRNFSRVVELRRAQSREGYQDYVPTPMDLSPRNLKCPGCRENMETHPYFGPGRVVIDSCGSCHLIWLDPGELHRIESAR